MLNNLKSKLPEFDTRMAWKKSENNHNVELSLSSMEWNIMSACDGARTIDDIINAADYDPADILKTLADFIEKGLIGPADSASGKEVNTSHLESQIDILADLLNRFLNKA
jgi:DNA-binding MarR family transcriptional regulator